jgi:FkbM family methyltransferase
MNMNMNKDKGSGKIKVSVILPVYNVIQYLERCLTSIFNQNFTDYELIIIEDGSTDGSELLVDDLVALSPVSTKVIHQCNAGLSAARKRGVEISEGKYLYFVDSDDFLEPFALSELFYCAEKYNAEIVIYNANIYCEKTNSIYKFYDWEIWEDFFNTEGKTAILTSFEKSPTLLELEPASWKRFYLKEFWISAGLFFPEGLLFEDIPNHFTMLLKAQRIALLNKPLINYRINRPGKITLRGDRKVFDIFTIFKHVGQIIDSFRIRLDDETLALVQSVYFSMQTRFYLWLFHQLNSNLKKDFFRNAQDALSKVSPAEWSSFNQQYKYNFSLRMSVTCLKNGYFNWFCSLAGGDMPWQAWIYCNLFIKDYYSIQNAFKRRLLAKPGMLEYNKFRYSIVKIDSPWQGEPISENSIVTSKVHNTAFLFFVDDVQHYRNSMQRLSNLFFGEDIYIPLRPGDNVIISGVRSGLNCVYLATKYPTVNFYAIEHDEKLYSCLCKNIELNNLSNVVCERAVIAESSSTIHMVKNNNPSIRQVDGLSHHKCPEDWTSNEAHVCTLTDFFTKNQIGNCRLLLFNDIDGLFPALKPLQAIDSFSISIDYIMGEVDPQIYSRWQTENLVGAVVDNAFLRFTSAKKQKMYHIRRHNYKVSVIVPIYNIEQFLPVCVDSLISQTLKDIEIILVNDGSTDGSLKLINQYIDKYDNIVLVDKANGGCASARNAGMQVARGMYIGFVDSDDWVSSEMFEELLQLAESNDADIAQGGLLKYYELDNITKPEQEEWVVELLKESQNSIYGAERLLHLQPTIWRRIYRRSFLETHQIKFNESLKLFDDLPFQYMTFCLADTIVANNKPYYYYRLQREGQDVMANDEKLFIHFPIFNILDAFMRDNKLWHFYPYFLKIKLNTHAWAFSNILPEFKEQYFNNCHQDLQLTVNSKLKKDFYKIFKHDKKNVTILNLFLRGRLKNMIKYNSFIINPGINLQAELNIISNSRSWKITRPLRVIKMLFSDPQGFKAKLKSKFGSTR